MQIVIGLTGGTGCGKSTAAAYLQKKGANIIDADHIAREITAPGSPALAEINAVFPDMLLPDGALNRKKLGALIFSDQTARHTLNKITHAYIIKEIENRLAAKSHPLTVIDAPLLLECGLERLCTVCVCILSSPAKRLERLIKRDHLSKAHAVQRMNAQPANDFYRSRCHFVIENNGDVLALEQALDAILKELLP